MNAPASQVHVSPDDRPPAFDQRTWPTVVALAIWAALVAVVIVEAGGFDDPRPWRNGWMRLCGVAASFALLIWATKTIHPRRAARLRLAVVVSLVAHTALAIALGDQWLVVRHDPRPSIVATPQNFAPRTIELPASVRDSSRSVRTRETFEQPLTIGPPAAAVERGSRRSATLDLQPVLSASPDDSTAGRATPPLDSSRAIRTTRTSAAPSAPAATRTRSVGRVSLPPPKVEVTPMAGPSRLSPSPTLDLAVSAPPPSQTANRWAPHTFTFTPSALVADGAQRPLLNPLSRRGERARPSEPAESGPPHREIRRAELPWGPNDASPPDVASPRVAQRPNPAPAFAHRRRRHDGQSASVRRTTSDAPDVALAVENGLEFLARVQLDDGRWRFEYLAGTVDPDEESVSIRADSAATGLALLSYLGAGYDHLDGRYARVVRDGLDYLTIVQQQSGELFTDDAVPAGQVTRFYSHGIATLALCEAYGMTGDADLYQPAQQAINYLVATQHPEMGGWRYQPGINSDLSVTGWQLAALRSGQLAGLAVRRETVERIGECLELCREEGGRRALFRYNPWASPSDPQTRHGRQPSTVMTSVGLLMQLQLGGDPSDQRIQAGAEQLRANLPRVAGPDAVSIGTLGNPDRDTYYWYYATQAMYYLGGDDWQQWSARLHPLLVDSQTDAGPLAGSWDPLKPVPDRWANYGGRIYVTAMNLLSLEIDQRHLPWRTEPVPLMAERPGE